MSAKYIFYVFVWTALAAVGVRGQDFGFGDYQVVSSTRVDRTTFEYVMRVRITNGVAPAQGVTAQVFSLSPHTEVVQGSVSFGNLSFLASAQSVDTFTIRQDRLFEFDPSQLRWFALADSMPLQVTITDPASGYLTNGTNVVVTGTVGAGVETLQLRGANVPIAGNTFTATVPLEEGRNVVTATAANHYGGLGTASITVTRDTVAPLVSVQEPVDGAVVAKRQITVSGLVNDAVPGTVNPEQASVMVNGLASAVLNRTYSISDVLLAPGSNTINVVARDRAGNETSLRIGVIFQDAAQQKRILMLGGDQQTGMIGTLLPDPLLVQLVDGDGVPQTNQPVTFSVTRNDGVVSASPDSGRNLTVMTDEKGQARTLFQLGHRTGAGNNQVAATAPGILADVLFNANATGAPPAKISALIPETQVGEAGHALPLPWTVLVTDGGGNPVEGAPVIFSVLQGGGNFAGAGNYSTNSDADGRAAMWLTLGSSAGVNNNIASASVPGVTNSVAVFTATALTAQQVADTRVVGLVLDNANRPMTNVLCQIAGTLLYAVTDSQGQFVIPGAPVGAIRLLVDARNRGYPGEWHFLQFDLVTIAGQDNSVDRPIYMLRMDEENAKLAGGDEDVTLELAGIPGSSLKILAHSVRDAAGHPITNLVSWTQVNLDRVPMAPPLGSQFTLAWAVQPANLRFNPPARVCVPNRDGQPGQVYEMFGFDHDIGTFVSIGTGTVTPDATQICSDPGFGITKSGWGGAVPPPPPPTCAGSCDDHNPCTADSCQDGVCVHTPTNQGGRCDDASGCSVKVCQGTACVTQTQQADGNACDDKKFCTDDDKCKDGACVGKPVEYPTVEVTQAYNISEMINLIKQAAKPVEEVTSCHFGDVAVSGSFGLAFEKKCCEDEKIREASGTKLKGSIGVDLPELECAVPGLGRSFLGGAVEIGLFVFVKGGGSVSASGGKNPCTQKDEFCIEGSVSLTVGARAKAVLGDDDVLALKAEAATGGAVSVSCCNGAGEFKVAFNPLTVTGTVTLAGFIDKSVSWALPPFPVIGPVAFTCPGAG